MAHFVSPEAAAELDQIWRYIAKESGSIDRADRLVDSITERFYLLSTFPRLGRKRPDLRHGLRSFHAGEYAILYRLEGTEDVLILHVLRGRQDIQAYV